MSDTADRDARRWASYERLAADRAASPSERAQAGDRLAELRARYPEGRPVRPGERRYAHGAGWGRAGAASAWEAAYREAAYREAAARAAGPPEDPEAARAREAAQAEVDRQHREEAVRQQRANVERVPGWARSGTLQDLHASPLAWSPEDHERFKEQRARLTGSSRAVDL